LIWSRRHKHETQQKFAIKAKEAFETLKDRLAKAESMQKASMVVESQNKCLADELNEYIEQILERETSIVVERTAALHAEELARVRLESEASASHAVEKKLQEMSTLHSAELT
jgi:predicted dinucleotide-utilizing enzyme